MNKSINYGGIFTKKQKPPIKEREFQYSAPDLDIQQESLEEIEQVRESFREKAKQEIDLKKSNTDAENFTCIVFQNSEQRNSFFEQLGFKSDDLQYVNGLHLMRALEMRIDSINKKTPGRFRCNKDLLTLSAIH